MKDIYEVEVDGDVFEQITLGKCNYVLVLNDKQHQTFKVGNLLTIFSGENSFKVSISNILSFATVKELVDMIGKENSGFTKNLSTDKIDDLVARTIKPESIEKFGLLAVGFEKVENS